jgi:hypothetical protein
MNEVAGLSRTSLFKNVPEIGSAVACLPVVF